MTRMKSRELVNSHLCATAVAMRSRQARGKQGQAWLRQGCCAPCLPSRIITDQDHDSAMTDRGEGTAAGQRTGLVLLTLASGQFPMTLDSSVMNVAIATVAKDVGTTVTGIQTAITLYTLMMAMLMITGGKVGPLIGRRRAFSVGCVIYGAGSLITVLAQNLAVLIVGWSVLEGIGAGPGRARDPGPGAPRPGRAGGDAAPAGPGRRGVVGRGPRARGVRHAALQHVGTGAAQAGWSGGLGLSPAIVLIFAGLLVLWLFSVWEHHVEKRGAEPLVRLSMLGNRQFAGLVMFFFQFLIQAGLFFTIPLYLSVALGLSAIDTGIKIIPCTRA